MFFLLHGFLIILFLVLIVLTCSLFTNAIEHLGENLKLGNNATGCILAVVGTSLPETIVPLVAILGSLILKTPAVGQNIATGAIIGSPFMLSTLALFLTGLALFLLKNKRKQELNVNTKDIFRFYKYFLITYILGISASFVHIKSIKILIGAILILSYIFFVKRTLDKEKDCFIEEPEQSLLFSRILKLNESIPLILVQILTALIGLILFSHFFVEEISNMSTLLKLSPILLSLIVTPFATELPECINSLIWVKENKDDLAIANVLGAIVFQAAIPMSIGIFLTPWILDKTILLNSFLVVLCSSFIVASILIAKKVKTLPLLSCIVFYLGYIIFILVK